GRGRNDGDPRAAAAFLKLHDPRGGGVDRVAPADPDAVAGLEAGAALAHDDLAAGDRLAGEHLHAEALGVRVAAVARGAEALLMRHLTYRRSSRCGSASAPGGGRYDACSRAWA